MSAHESTSNSAHLPQPDYRKRSPKWELTKKWLARIVIALVTLTVLAFIRLEVVDYGDPVHVTWKDLHGLRVGSELRMEGGLVGRVETIASTPAGWRVTFDIKGEATWIEQLSGIRDRSVWKQISRDGSEFRIERFVASIPTGVEGASIPIHGPFATVTVGNGNIRKSAEFTGVEERPLDGITRHSERIRVFWTDLHGLEYSRFVTFQGTPVGRVTSITRGENDIDGHTHTGWWVEIAFFHTIGKDSPILTSLGEYYLNYTDSEGLRVFNPTGIVNGTTVEIRLSPGEAEPLSIAIGKTTLPPDTRITPDSPRITVNFLAAYNVQEMAMVVDNATEAEIGQVLDKGRPFVDTDGKRKVPLTIALFESGGAYNKENASWYVVRARTDRDSVSLEGSETFFTGEKIAVIPGNPDGEQVTTFTGRWEPRPHREVDWDDLRIQVDCRNAKLMELGAPFVAAGRRIGEVETISDSPRSMHARLGVVLYHYKEAKPELCPYALEKTRYFPTALEASFQGIAGDLRTLVQGTYLVAMPDPYYIDQDVQTGLVFQAENRSAPTILPQEGEQQLRLRLSRASVEPDTPVFVKGTLVGYVHSVENRVALVRLFPIAQSHLFKASKWFVPEVVKTQVLRRNSWTDWEGPRVDFNPEALRQKYIEFRTPSEDRGEWCNLSKSNWTFTLYEKPEEAWLKWDW